MEQGLQSVGPDLPRKNLARQLDFTALLGVSGPERQQSAEAPSLSQYSIPIAVTESPNTRPRPAVDVNNDTPKKQKQCNCKNSKCLKLYCECFTSGVYCNGCNCVNCLNNGEYEALRHEAIESTLECNPTAFQPKIVGTPQAIRDTRQVSEKRTSVANISSTGLESSKVTLRPLLAEVIQPNKVKELCSHWVVQSQKIAKRFSDGKGLQKSIMDRPNLDEVSLASSTCESKSLRKDHTFPDASNIIHSNRVNILQSGRQEEGAVDLADILNDGRSLSPTTRALMCDEQESTLIAPTFNNPHISRSQQCQKTSGFYLEQERCILLDFHRWLKNFIIRGSMKGISYKCLNLVSNNSKKG